MYSFFVEQDVIRFDGCRGWDCSVLLGDTATYCACWVPQLLLEESINNDSNSNHPPAPQDEEEERTKRRQLVVTQPRNVAAISLAHRVADERGYPPQGSKGSTVGTWCEKIDVSIIYMTIARCLYDNGTLAGDRMVVFDLLCLILIG